MNLSRIRLFFGCAALAGALAAQPVFHFDAPPGPEPGMWLMNGQSVQAPGAPRSFLGVGVTEIDATRAKALKLKEERGVVITRVQEDSPAEKAGLKVGDVVLEYNSQRIEGTEQFVRLVRETPAGRDAQILVHRGGSNIKLTATIESMKSPPLPNFDVRLDRLPEELRGLRMPDMPQAYMSWRSSILGVEAESLSSQLAAYFGVKEGVLVRSVLDNSAAAAAGMKAGDVIVKVGDEKVTTPKDVSEAVRSQREKKTFPVAIMRDRKEMTLNVTIDAQKPVGRPVRQGGEKL